MPSFVASAPTVLVLSMMLSKRGVFIFCQTLHQVAVGALHQAVEHLDHVQARAQRRIHRAHLQADDAAAEDQHALRVPASSSAPVESTTRGSFGMNGSCTACEPAAMIALLELDGLRLAGLLLAGAAGFFHLEVERVDELADAAHHRDLAHLGHRGQPTRELAHHLGLVRAQFGQVDRGLAEAHAERLEMADLVHDGGDVKQSL